MHYRKAIPENMIERCEYHSHVYNDPSLFITKLGELGAYFYLSQRYGNENVSKPYVLKLDDSNKVDINLIYGATFFVNNTMKIFCNTIPSSVNYDDIRWCYNSVDIESLSNDDHSDTKLLCGQMDIDSKSYTMNIYKDSNDVKFTESISC
jgi:hypothetical protein